MKEEWLMPTAVVPVDAKTTAALVNEVKRLIGVVGSMALNQQRTWVGLNHFDRTLLRTTYAPLKRLHHIKETNTDIVEEIINDWDAFFTAIEAKLKEKNTYDAAAAIRSRG